MRPLRRVEIVAVLGTALILDASLTCAQGIVPPASAASAASQADSAPVTLWSVRPSVGESGESPVAARVDRAGVTPASTDGARPARPSHEFVIAPIPMINPTLENGLAIAIGELYTIGRGSPPSGTMGMGFRTSNDSWAIGLAQLLHLDRDRYRATIAAAYFDVNFDYFGIGSEAGAEGRSIPLNQSGYVAIADLLVRLGGGRWYAGARYRITRTAAGADFTDTSITIPQADIRLRTAALGPHIERDTRDDQFYPKSGTLLDVIVGFAGEGIGGHRSYQTYQANVGVYTSLSPRQVLAARVNSCFADGDVPFYDLCLLGQFQDLRGYPTGQYRDRALLTGQTEYRLEVWKRIGVVVFGGAGEVADGFGALTADGVLPTGGAGVRFRLTRQNHLNLRADYARGKRSNALYISVGEAF